MKWLITLILLTSTLIAKEQVKFYKPSFDCKKITKKNIGYQICTNEKLSKLDIELATIYNTLKKSIPEKEVLKELMIDKISFLTQRDKCKDIECMKSIYQNQIHTLVKTYEIYRVNEIYETLKKVNTDNFIHPNNRKSTIFTSELLKFIQNKELKNIQFKNNYLFTVNKGNLEAGLYCANNTTGEVSNIHGGFIDTWQGFVKKDYLKVITQTNSGKKGLGYTGLLLFRIDGNCKITKKRTILEYNYDMESGLCGRRSLNLEKSADIKKLEFNTEKKLMKVNISKQQCPNGKVSNKDLIFDISTEKFID